MSLSQINVGGQTVDVYGTPAELNAYAAGVVFPAGSSFTTDPDRINQLLVSVTRLFETTGWVGTVTDLATPQPLQWPRTGVTDKNDQAVPPATTPADVFSGFFQMCVDVDLDTDQSLLATGTTGSNVKSESATDKVGDLETSREKEYFVGTAVGSQKAGQFPSNVLQFLRPFLDSQNAAIAGLASGTCQKSAFQNGPKVTGILSDFGLGSGGVS